MTALRTFRSVKLSLVRETIPEPYRGTLRHGGNVASLARAVLGDDPREGFLAFYLDGSQRSARVSLAVRATNTAPLGTEAPIWF